MVKGWLLVLSHKTMSFLLYAEPDGKKKSCKKTFVFSSFLDGLGFMIDLAYRLGQSKCLNRLENSQKQKFSCSITFCHPARHKVRRK